ncbi:hypothetical protein MWU38_12345 [Qipengyuania sp. S6317L1]|uniref:hypothetical protein n=1 Tax=Qipengyuania sp. S6317L1 TaxID=2926410 RepID=UPI001FF44050|nr:hypothetical protein [Qipengyuania sp. S6317L1]MCK0100174.1 hypothetical protein [Qipengyuania sp. S6317L1]
MNKSVFALGLAVPVSAALLAASPALADNSAGDRFIFDGANSKAAMTQSSASGPITSTSSGGSGSSSSGGAAGSSASAGRSSDVPAPGVLTLLGLALVSIALGRRRKERSLQSAQ